MKPLLGKHAVSAQHDMVKVTESCMFSIQMTSALLLVIVKLY